MTYLAAMGEQQINQFANPDDIDTSTTWREMPGAVAAGLYGIGAAGAETAGLAFGGAVSRYEDLFGADHDVSSAIFEHAVDAPKAFLNELDAKQTHMAAQVVASAIKGVGSMIYGGAIGGFGAMAAGLAVTAFSERATGEIQQGHDLLEANTKAMVQAATTYAGAKIALNIPGGIAAKVTGGAGANVISGVAGRAGEKATSALFGDEQPAQDIFDPTAMATDVVMGAAFGGMDAVYHLYNRASLEASNPNKPQDPRSEALQDDAIAETASAIDENRPADISGYERTARLAAPDAQDIESRLRIMHNALADDRVIAEIASHQPPFAKKTPASMAEPAAKESLTVEPDKDASVKVPKPEDPFVPRDTESAAGMKPLHDIDDATFSDAMLNVPQDVQASIRSDMDMARNQITETDSFLKRVAGCILNGI